MKGAAFSSLKLPALAVLIFVLGLLLGGMYVKIQYLQRLADSGKQLVNNDNQPKAVPDRPSAPTKVEVKISPDDPVKGSPNAKLTIVEFSDFQCPWCAKFFTDVFPQIKKDYIDTGKVKFVYKNLVISEPLGSEPESHNSAVAALCAKEQNKFWEYHDYLFTHQNGENQGAFSKVNLKKFAVDLGLNSSQFNDCLDSNKYDSQIQADIAEAGKWAFNATPYITVGTTSVRGVQPYAQFKAVIDAELQK